MTRVFARILVSWRSYLLYWNNPQDFCTFFQIKRKLPEHQIHEIFKDIRKRALSPHFWAPESMMVKEQVGLNFPLERKRADRVAGVRAYFDGEPARTQVEEFSEDEAGVIGEISDEINFVLAVPIFSDDSRSNIIGIVDLYSSNEIGQALLASSVSDNVMWQLAEHIRIVILAY